MHPSPASLLPVRRERRSEIEHSQAFTPLIEVFGRYLAMYNLVRNLHPHSQSFSVHRVNSIG
jgi:hypothetical protein